LQTVYGSNTQAYTGATITATTRTHNYHTCDYPRPLNECEACHVAGAYGVPNQGKAVAVTNADAGGGTLVTTSSSTWGIQTDDVLIGPAAAACMSCHQSSDALVQAALKQHAYQNGWAPSTFTNGRADLLNGSGGIETCVVCHGN
jgi:OmcA/MtrC family decaheme c-type cytochrome